MAIGAHISYSALNSLNFPHAQFILIFPSPSLPNLAKFQNILFFFIIKPTKLHNQIMMTTTSVVGTPPSPPRTKITVIPGDFISENELSRCAELFSAHYGIWGEKGIAPGRPVRLTAARLRREYLFNTEQCYLVMAESKQGELVGQAFACRFPFRQGYACWITQLVVNKQWRSKGLATDLLSKCCLWKNCIAWGLASSHPHAVRALESAKKKKANVEIIKEYAQEIVALNGIPYMRECQFTINSDCSLAHTNYFVDHTEVDDFLEKEGTNWKMGKIGEGDEFLVILIDF